MAKMAVLSSLDLHIEQAYSRGFVPASDGTAMSLAPHTIDRAAGEALRDLAIAEGAQRTIEVGLALGLSALSLPGRGERAGASGIDRPAGVWGAGFARSATRGPSDRRVDREDSQLALPGRGAGKGFDLLHRRRSRFEWFFPSYYMTLLVSPASDVVDGPVSAVVPWG